MQFNIYKHTYMYMYTWVVCICEYTWWFWLVIDEIKINYEVDNYKTSVGRIQN